MEVARAVIVVGFCARAYLVENSGKWGEANFKMAATQYLRGNITIICPHIKIIAGPRISAAYDASASC